MINPKAVYTQADLDRQQARRDILTRRLHEAERRNPRPETPARDNGKGESNNNGRERQP